MTSNLLLLKLIVSPDPKRSKDYVKIKDSRILHVAKYIHRKKRSRKSGLTLIKVLVAISDLNSFKILALLYQKTNTYTTLKIKNALKLTRKQAYNRIQKLLGAKLITRYKKEVKLTAFGKVVMDSLRKVDNAIEIYNKLKAIDAVSQSTQATREEIEVLIESLVADEEIKGILKKMNFVPPTL